MLEGEINEINLVERLVELWREQFTGAIRFENDGIIKIIYFKGGDVLSASTNDRADSVDEILMRAGKVSREHVKQALAKRKENETLGDALLNLGFITRKELTWARRVQVVGVIRSITAWPAGQFTIVADYLPKRDEGTLFPLPQVLVELIVTDQDRQKFERAMDGGEAVFAKTAEFDDVFRRLGLNEQAEAIVKHIDGEKSVAQVATASGGDSFNVYKLLNALATLRVLNRVDSAAAQPDFTLDDEESGATFSWSEPAEPQPSPTFELDEAEALHQPTLEIQVPPAPEPASSASAWDEEEEATPVVATPIVATPAPAPITAAEKMPAWDVPPRTPAPAPIPVSVPPAAEAEEEQWGFDDAQIETVRRASTTTSTSKPGAPVKSGRRYGLIVALLLIFILAGAGYAGFVYWQKQQEPAPEAVVRRPARRPVVTRAPVTPPVTTMTVVETMATATQPTTTTQAPAPAPAPVPPPETAALPRIIPKPAPVVASTPAISTDGVRARYDAMARDFAANASGNFTVQIQILCEPSNIAKVLSAGGSNIWFVPQQLASRSCYRVFWGHYNTRDEAQRAMSAIPASLRDPSAAVKPVPKG